MIQSIQSSPPLLPLVTASCYYHRRRAAPPELVALVVAQSTARDGLEPEEAAALGLELSGLKLTGLRKRALAAGVSRAAITAPSPRRSK